MDYFNYKEDRLYCENVPIDSLAKKYGTPLYVYSLRTIQRHFSVFDEAFKDISHVICFSVKANPTLAILFSLANMGAGADIVSLGELFISLKAGMDAKKIVFSGVGKTEKEIESALIAKILMFNVESFDELDLIATVARRLEIKAPISFRVNPDVDPKTHPYISTGLKSNKFGISMEMAKEAYKRAIHMEWIDVIGIDCHIGSQLISLGPIKEAAARLMDFMQGVEGLGVTLRYIDVGGGLGIRYDQEEPPEPIEYAETIKDILKGMGKTIILEPGRVIVGNAGILVSKVIYTKKQDGKDFIIVDAGMNDLIRPALYGSFQRIDSVVRKSKSNMKTDIVGPICESSDFFAKDRLIEAKKRGDLLAIFGAGAYGVSMASNYNFRPRPAQVLIHEDKEVLITKRETLDDMIACEAIPSFMSFSQEAYNP